jgi:D-proline reductase (dithiol) PrdB
LTVRAVRAAYDAVVSERHRAFVSAGRRATNEMPRLEDLDPESREFLENFQCRSDGDPPWARVEKPLEQSRIAVITTSGLIRKSDVPFDLGNPEGDFSFRVVPMDTDPADLTFSHVSTNWDRTGFAMDINVVLPVTRLGELAAEGVIGSVARNFYAFMGAIFNFDSIIRTSAPAVADLLKADGVDVALFIPT